MNSEQEAGAQGMRAQDQAGAGAGAMLRRAREEAGLSLADIAARTRIPIRQLEVIEAGAFASLPSRTYAIGFARTYARAVGLNEGEVTKAVRTELGDTGEARSYVPGDMEPGDPAKLPSRGLAWAGGAGAVLLMVGLFAWFSSQFRAGEEPAPLVADTQEAAPATARAAATSDGTPAAALGEAVVFTATEDGVWVRLFEEGGERYLQKTLTKGESFAVPAGARDPRLNTARPDALSLTIGGKPAAPLAARPVVLSSEPVSGAALAARAAAMPAASAAAGGIAATAATAPATVREQPRRRVQRAAVPSAEETPVASEPQPTAAPVSAPSPATAPPEP